MDAGDLSVSRSAQTRERQRLCQIVKETIKTGEQIDLTPCPASTTSSSWAP